MAALTSINDELKSAAPAASDESQSESGAAPSDGDARYPFVTLSSGELLRVALGDDGPLPASPETVGEELERAVATGPGGAAGGGGSGVGARGVSAREERPCQGGAAGGCRAARSW